MYANFHLKRELNNKLACGRVQHPGFPVHFHSHLELYLIRSGAVEILVNDQKRVLRQGEISIAFSYDAHGYRSVDDDAVADFLIVPLSYCNDILPLLEQHRGSSFIHDPHTYALACDAMDRLLEHPNELLQRGYVYVILGAILDQASLLPREETPSTRFSADILIYVSQHFREDLTLAKRFGYHPSYLSRLFRQSFGITFNRYLTMLRLRDAVLRMRSGESSVTESAMESGFGSMRSFYRAFHEEFGRTPKEYFAKSAPSAIRKKQ